MTIKMLASELPKPQPPPCKGCKRAWYHCRRCQHVQYSLSAPFLWCSKCGASEAAMEPIEVIEDEKRSDDTMFKPVIIQKFDTDKLQAGTLAYVSVPDAKDGGKRALCFIQSVTPNEITFISFHEKKEKMSSQQIGTFATAEPSTLKAQEAYVAGAIIEPAILLDDADRRQLVDHLFERVYKGVKAEDVYTEMRSTLQAYTGYDPEEQGVEYHTKAMLQWMEGVDSDRDPYKMLLRVFYAITGGLQLEYQEAAKYLYDYFCRALRLPRSAPALPSVQEALEVAGYHQLMQELVRRHKDDGTTNQVYLRINEKVREALNLD